MQITTHARSNQSSNHKMNKSISSTMNFSITFVASIYCWGPWERNNGSVRARKYEDAYLWMIAKSSKKRVLYEYPCNFWMDDSCNVPPSQNRYEGFLKGFQALIWYERSSMGIFVLVVWKVGISTDPRILYRKKRINSMKDTLPWPRDCICSDDEGSWWRDLVSFHAKWPFTVQTC